MRGVGLSGREKPVIAGRHAPPDRPPLQVNALGVMQRRRGSTRGRTRCEKEMLLPQTRVAVEGVIKARTEGPFFTPGAVPRGPAITVRKETGMATASPQEPADFPRGLTVITA